MQTHRSLIGGFGLTLLLTLSGMAIGPSVLQAAQRIDSDRPEAWAMNYFTSVSLLAGLGPPSRRKFGSVDLGVELGWIPSLSKSQRKVGFNGVKEEDLNKAPIFGRPRLTLGLPWNVAMVLSYVPPVPLFGVRANLFAFGLERPIYEHPPWTLGLRGYGQIGHIDGAFTCSSDVVKFKPGSAGNPAGCQKESNDRAIQHYGGLELTGAYRFDKLKGLTPWVAVAGNYLDNAFHVRAQTFGFQDRTRLATTTWTFSASGGVIYPLSDKLQVSVGVFYTPLEVTRPPETSSHLDGLLNVRTLLTYRWR